MGFDFAGYRRALLIIAVTGVVSAFAAFLLVRSHLQGAEADEMRHQSVQYRAALQSYLDRHLLLLHAIAGQFAGPSAVTRDDFAATAAKFLPLFPELRMAGLLVPVSRSAITGFEAMARREGAAEYRIRNADDGVPQGDVVVHYYLEPRQGNEDRLGINALSIPGVAAAVVAARDTGTVTAPTRVRLLDDPAGQFSLVLYLPIYWGGDIPSSIEERRRRFRGLICAAVPFSKILRAAFQTLPPPVTDLYLIDRTAGAGQRYLARTEPPGSPALPPPSENLLDAGPHVLEELAIGGRMLQLMFHPRPGAFLRWAEWPAWTSAALLLLATALLAGYVARERDAKAALSETITERERVAARLERAQAAADAANEAKSRFLAAASHDLRQPYQAMMLFHTLLHQRLKEEKDLEISRLLGDAMNSGRNLLDALFDVSALEAAAVRPTITTFPCADLFDALADEFRHQAAAKRLELRVVSCGLNLHSDRTLVLRIMRNLVSNACRYTEQGAILLGARRAGPEFARLEVWDTGPGIPLEKIPLIFEDFYQLGNPERDRSKGLGLGLSTVERMARLLDSELTVFSRPGRGSVFAISVPVASRAEGGAARTIHSPAESAIAEPAPELV